MNDLYLLWSFDHEAWWRPNRAGYTIRIEEAGRYGAAEAGKLATGDIMLNTLPVHEAIVERQGSPTYHPFNGQRRRDP